MSDNKEPERPQVESQAAVVTPALAAPIPVATVQSAPTVKIDQVRNVPGGALIKTISGQQVSRLIMASPIQPSTVITTASISNPATTVLNVSSTSVVTTTSSVATAPVSVQSQIVPKIAVQSGTPVASVGRISSLPVQATTGTSYHVPRGAAAVANIAPPRSSVATPYVRAPAPLQALGVTQHTIPAGTVSTNMGGRVLGQWLGMSCPPGTQPARHAVPQLRPPTTVGARLTVGSQIRGTTETQARPVVLHTTTTHKQVTLTQQAQQVQVTDKGVLKSYSQQPARITGIAPPSAPALSRITANLPPMLSLHPAVLVPSGQSIPIKGTAGTAKVLTQPGQTVQTMQISSVPASSAVQPSALAISTVVTRPVMLGTAPTQSAVQGNAAAASVVRAPAKVFPAGQPVTVSTEQTSGASPVFIHTQTHKPASGTTMSMGSVVNISGGAMYTALPASSTSYYEGSFQMAPTRHVTTSSAPTQVQSSSGPPASSQPPTVLTQAPVSQSSQPVPTSSTPVSSTSAPPPAPSVRPPQITTQAPQGLVTTSSHQQQISTQPIKFNQVMLLDSPRPQTHFLSNTEGLTSSEISGALALTTMAPGIASVPKPNTSPRPSILRKRDPDGSPMKAQKNLTSVLNTLTVATPTSPPSPKRPESGNSGQSSGSTTISATSSPGGESPPHSSSVPVSLGSVPTSCSPSMSSTLNESKPPPVAPPTTSAASLQPLSSLPEVSPRKKPRKQQLTGNQITEPTFSEDEMEFISEDKIKKEVKDEVAPEKHVKRNNVSLLSMYRHNWKSRNNHFLRYVDIKVKDDKKPTLTDIANQKQALQKVHGWKIYHLSSQSDDLLTNENEYSTLFSDLLSKCEGHKLSRQKDLEKEMIRIIERVKANYQRSKVVKDQLQEGKGTILRLLDHKDQVIKLLSQCVNKRSLKKRERT